MEFDNAYFIESEMFDWIFISAKFMIGLTS